MSDLSLTTIKEEKNNKEENNLKSTWLFHLAVNTLFQIIYKLIKNSSLVLIILRN